MKTKLNKVLSTFTLSAIFTGSALAQGIPVIDASAIAKHLEQIAQMKQQIENQVSQIVELKNQVTALTSVEGLKNAAKDVTLNNIPTEWKDIYKDIDGLTQSDVDSILSLKNYDPSGGQKALANQVLHLEKAFQETTQRLTRLNGLQDKLKTATNVKEAADIQNQIATESAAITVAQTQLDNMHRTYEVQKEIHEQQRKRRDSCISKVYLGVGNLEGCN